VKRINARPVMELKYSKKRKLLRLRLIKVLQMVRNTYSMERPMSTQDLNQEM